MPLVLLSMPASSFNTAVSDPVDDRSGWLEVHHVSALLGVVDLRNHEDWSWVTDLRLLLS